MYLMRFIRVSCQCSVELTETNSVYNVDMMVGKYKQLFSVCCEGCNTFHCRLIICVSLKRRVFSFKAIFWSIAILRMASLTDPLQLYTSERPEWKWSVTKTDTRISSVAEGGTLSLQLSPQCDTENTKVDAGWGSFGQLFPQGVTQLMRDCQLFRLIIQSRGSVFGPEPLTRWWHTHTQSGDGTVS